MDALTLFFNGASVVTILIAAFGALKMNRRNLLLGTFLYSLLPVIGESNQFHATGDYGNLITAVAFLCAAIITFPNRITYSSENQAAVKLAQKIGLSVIVLNVLQGYVIMKVRTDVPIQFAYAHLTLALIFVYVIIKSKSGDFKMN
jgi:peptidoglycan/LPS O-acetylase OafA/YrhL